MREATPEDIKRAKRKILERQSAARPWVTKALAGTPVVLSVGDVPGSDEPNEQRVRNVASKYRLKVTKLSPTEFLAQIPTPTLPIGRPAQDEPDPTPYTEPTTTPIMPFPGGNDQ